MGAQLGHDGQNYQRQSRYLREPKYLYYVAIHDFFFPSPDYLGENERCDSVHAAAAQVCCSGDVLIEPLVEPFQIHLTLRFLSDELRRRSPPRDQLNVMLFLRGQA